MNTKQEKLAAARRKLKEFQGKQRENDVNRMRNVVSPAEVNRKLSTGSTSTDAVSKWRMEQNNLDHRSPEISYPSNALDIQKSEGKMSNYSTAENDSRNPADYAFPTYQTISFTSNVAHYPDPYPGSGDSQMGSDFFNKQNIADNFPINPGITKSLPSANENGLYTDETNSPYTKLEQYSAPDSSESKVKAEICTLFKDSDGFIAAEREANFPNLPQETPLNNDPKEFFSSNVSNSASNEMAAKQTKMQWDAQTSQSILQLSEEKNNLLQVLKSTEELLKLKTDQEENLARNVSFLQLKATDLEGRLMTVRNEAAEYKALNDKLMKQRDIDFNMLEELQRRLNSQEEQFSETQQKLELKMRECEISSSKIKDYESQLSSSLLKIQQLRHEDTNDLNIKIVDLQNENSRLTGRIQDLEKKLEILDREKEQSSQSFQTYAQLYDGQINSLSTEVRNLVKENQQLLEMNETLEKTVKELRRQKEEYVPPPPQSLMTVNTDKIGELMEENAKLQKNLKEKIDEIEVLEKDKLEKCQEIVRINAVLTEMRSDYMKRQEDSNSHQKLLATIESEKVAASRAVAQNHKLKEQVAELEEGFIKLSHEKLQLTDELYHERHVKKELELRLQELESDHCRDHDHHGTTNESADIEELRSIIRQLEEDKTELISRLNSNNSNKISKYTTPEVNGQAPETRDDDVHNDPESSKILLQQMEEKVKKTMNEIAALDEEKEKLEHLVTQLQCETETIGEYISLYQTQRMMLKQRNKEKDDQLMQLAKDKEELKSKLSMLNDLVNSLIIEKGVDCGNLTDVNSIVSNDNKEVTEETAVKIQSLINEIQSTNLIDNQSVAFEHCPCCSGRLITI